jgi:hypothetical protein
LISVLLPRVDEERVLVSVEQAVALLGHDRREQDVPRVAVDLADALTASLRSVATPSRLPRRGPRNARERARVKTTSSAQSTS